MKSYDIIVIGAGPAGISASIYAKRSNINVLALYYGESELEKANKIENLYGFPEGISGKQLYKNGIAQAKNLGVDVLEQEITDIELLEDSSYIVKSINNSYKAKAIIIASGNKKITPNIKGIKEFEGRGISYCAVCDGFFYKGKDVAVIGDGNFALSEVGYLENIAKSVKILTNGRDVRLANYNVDTRKIKEIGGENRVRFIKFEDEKESQIDGIFIAQGIAGGINFARKLGIITNSDSIVVDKNMQTNVKGIFACGNLTGGLLQINKAAYEGAKAGLQAVKYVKEQKKG